MVCAKVEKTPYKLTIREGRDGRQEGTFKLRRGGGESAHVIVKRAGKSIPGSGPGLSEDWVGGLRVKELTLPLEPMGP